MRKSLTVCASFICVMLMASHSAAVGQKISTSTNIDLKVKFRGSILDGQNPSNDKVVSDGGGYLIGGTFFTYVDGSDGVEAKFYDGSTTDAFILNLNQGKTKAPRYLHVLYGPDNQVYRDNAHPMPDTNKFRGRIWVKYANRVKAYSHDGSLATNCPSVSAAGCRQDEAGHTYMLTYGDVGNLVDGSGYTYVNRFQETGYGTEYPCNTLFFRVYHFPAGYAAGYDSTLHAFDRWIITPDTSAPYEQNGYSCGGSVAGLTRYKGGSGHYLVGQFQMPFEITLTRK